VSSTQPFDLLVRGAMVLDGSGGPRFRADVAVRGQRIAAVGDLPYAEATLTLEASDRMLAPGFVDMHSHSDRTLLINPRAEAGVRQGVTLEVIGNCGMSVAPLTDSMLGEEATAFGRWVDYTPTWRSMGEYLTTLENNGLGINVAALVGHGTVRRAAMGYAMRAPTSDELAQMRRLVADSLAEGAVGMATGLIYPPGTYSQTDELIELSRPVAEAGGIYASHVRNEGLGLLEATAEAIRIGRESGASVQISHHKASSPRAWGLVNQSLPMIDRANAEGVRVDFDQYPYIASSTGLGVILPSWAHEGGWPALERRLLDPAERARIAEASTSARRTAFAAGLGWDGVLIASSPLEPVVEGRTVAEIAAERGADPMQAVLDMLQVGQGNVGAIYFSMCEDDVRTVMRHPRMMVGSDSASAAPYAPLNQGKPHPRGYGTFARILGHYVRDEAVLTWEEAAHKMAYRGAQKLALTDRGAIRVGNYADLVVFDPLRVRETATYIDPHQFPNGVEHVVVNGTLVVKDGEHTGALPGQVFRLS
jgi:N-acyl-D-amino-acid deacylase